MRGARAFTLLEALVTVVILGGLISVVFTVLTVGISGFKLGTTRLDLQSELRRILAPLRRDLQNSSFQSASVVQLSIDVAELPPNPSPLTSVHRDGVCFNSLQNIQADSSYDAATGLPKWDCYTVYFATLDQPDGKLVRILLRDPTPYDVLSNPLVLLAGDLSLSNPNLIGKNIKVLSTQVMEFGTSLDQSNQLATIHLRLRGKAGHQEMGGRSTAEVLEIRTSVMPANTFPRL